MQKCVPHRQSKPDTDVDSQIEATQERRSIAIKRLDVPQLTDCYDRQIKRAQYA